MMQRIDAGWLGQRAIQYQGQLAGMGANGLMDLFSVSAEPGTLTCVPSLGDEYTPAEATINRIFDRLNQRIGAIIMTSADKAVQDVTAQLTKAKGEIDAEVAKLQDAGVSADSLAGLQSISQSLDDANPDAAPAEPAAPADEAPIDGATDTST